MKKFSDLGIKIPDDRRIFNVPVVSITDVLNCEIEVIDYESGITTSQGTNRYVIKIRYEDKECKFFTDSKRLKEMIDQVNKEDFLFKTIIKQIKFGSGSGKTFEFT